MEITFRNRKLQKSCSVRKEAVRTYGANRAKRLMQRLMELSAADHLAQIPTTPPTRCHELKGNLKGTFSVDLEHPWRLLFVPTHDPIPRKKDGGVDKTRVTSVEITAIEDTH